MREEPMIFRAFLEQRVELQGPVRILMAVVVGFGGLAFTLLGIAVAVLGAGAPHPAGSFALAICVAGLGLGMQWLGLRLLRHRSSDVALLSSTARRRCSFVVGALAVGMLASAIQLRSASLLVVVASLVGFSYFIFPAKQ